MEYFKLILISLCLSACSPEKTKKAVGTVDFAFKPYVEMYKTDKKRFLGTEDIRPISVEFQSLRQDGNEGLCHYSNPVRLIQIDPISWLFGTQDDRIALFYHEMGHCDLGFHRHTEELSIMNPYGLTGEEFATDREGFLRKLFLEGK